MHPTPDANYILRNESARKNVSLVSILSALQCRRFRLLFAFFERRWRALICDGRGQSLDFAARKRRCVGQVPSGLESGFIARPLACLSSLVGNVSLSCALLFRFKLPCVFELTSLNLFGENVEQRAVNERFSAVWLAFVVRGNPVREFAETSQFFRVAVKRVTADDDVNVWIVGV